MSKYIIEIAKEYEEYFKGVLICGIADGKFAVDVIAVEDLEELNSDYINENFGELQDEAYQKGFEDGKKSVSEPGRIEVGDEVIAPCGKAVVTLIETDDLVHYLYSGGDYGCIEPQKLKKTGKHYDIASILEAMRT